MNLGWLDVCLRVADVRVSREFYDRLGFRRVEGDDADGWAVVVNGESRIGLYEKQHLGEGDFSLNFRGGDVATIAAELGEKGCEFVRALKVQENGWASATLKDPDGHTIFLDTAPGEVKKT